MLVNVGHRLDRLECPKRQSSEGNCEVAFGKTHPKRGQAILWAGILD